MTIPDTIGASHERYITVELNATPVKFTTLTIIREITSTMSKHTCMRYFCCIIIHMILMNMIDLLPTVSSVNELE